MRLFEGEKHAKRGSVVKAGAEGGKGRLEESFLPDSCRVEG